jgi:hypothetical protein
LHELSEKSPFARTVSAVKAKEASVVNYLATSFADVAELWANLGIGRHEGSANQFIGGAY